MIATSGFLAALECTKFVFGRGSARTPLRELTALPKFGIWFRGPTSKGKGAERKGRKRGERREKKGKKRGGRRKGIGEESRNISSSIPAYALVPRRLVNGEERVPFPNLVRSILKAWRKCRFR